MVPMSFGHHIFQRWLDQSCPTATALETTRLDLPVLVIGAGPAGLAAMAALATMLARYRRFRHILIFEQRNWPDRLVFALGLAVPFTAGVAARLLLAYDAADLTLEGALAAEPRPPAERSAPAPDARGMARADPAGVARMGMSRRIDPRRRVSLSGCRAAGSPADPAHERIGNAAYDRVLPDPLAALLHHDPSDLPPEP